MSQVAKLKELLFQPESEAIAKLTRRVEDVYQRAGSDTSFEASMARSIDGALRTAEVSKHDEVATALAPLVVRTVKTEIRNSSDDIAEALYPAMGRMVRDYVTSQIREMTEAINRRIEENALMVRLSAWSSGQSPAELALAESRRLTVEDVFLIRRSTGELLARWPEANASADADNVFGGVLTAINDFTAEAFKADGSALREIDLGGSRVYLRVSPTFLLAARCKGDESATAEKVLDEEFLALIERCRPDIDTAQALPPNSGSLPSRRLQPILADLSGRLSERLADIAPVRKSARHGMRPLSLVAALIAIPLVVWLGWTTYVRWADANVRAVALSIIEATPGMSGFPTDLKASGGGTALTLNGLTPSGDVQSSLVNRIAVALPGVAISDRLNTLPAGTDVRPMLAEIKQEQSAFEAEVRSATDKRFRERAAGVLAQAAAVLDAEAVAATGDTARAMARFASEATSLSATLEGGQDAPTAISKARSLEAELMAAARAVLDIGTDRPRNDPPVAAPTDILLAADRVALSARMLADRSAITRRLASETSALKNEIAALNARGLSPREALVQFTRGHAIFFNEGTGFRDSATATRIVDDLAALMKRDPSLVRIVGYTDDAGSNTTNQVLGQARGDAVAAELVRRGIPSNRLVVLRRTSPENNLSPISGAGSSNRRVEFEVGFVGEGSEG